MVDKATIPPDRSDGKVDKTAEQMVAPKATFGHGSVAQPVVLLRGPRIANLTRPHGNSGTIVAVITTVDTTLFPLRPRVVVLPHGSNNSRVVHRGSRVMETRAATEEHLVVQRFRHGSDINTNRAMSRHLLHLVKTFRLRPHHLRLHLRRERVPSCLLECVEDGGDSIMSC